MFPTSHLRAVHDVATQLTARLTVRYLTLLVDSEAVLFGAATHDIGRTVRVQELSVPGSQHQRAGQQLLLAVGIDASRARFSATHASWRIPTVQLEDLLVSLADKIWKAKRVPYLEQLVVDRLVAASGEEPWQAFLNLDDHLDTIAANADSRLTFQNRASVGKCQAVLTHVRTVDQAWITQQVMAGLPARHHLTPATTSSPVLGGRAARSRSPPSPPILRNDDGRPASPGDHRAR
jgi:hypothetical protein